MTVKSTEQAGNVNSGLLKQLEQLAGEVEAGRITARMDAKSASPAERRIAGSVNRNRGAIDVFIPADRFDGAYRVMAQGDNDMVAGHIAVRIRAVLRCCHQEP